ncbi:hypothetical protein BGW42_000283 [Actinomortierella wolfii]|nr:hypothetical protein BGW42_000283 [Actinomortierella wolfii]KAG0232390.1 hypothetical protein BGW41_001887 [Actinomortierella wolfii]
MSQSTVTTSSSSGSATTTHTTVSNSNKGVVPYRASRIPARLLLATGVGHLIVGLSMPVIRNPLWEAIKAGYFNQFKGYYTRSNSFWFMLAGAQLILTSHLIDSYLFDHVKATKVVTKRKIKNSKNGQDTEETTEVVPVRATRSDRKIPRSVGVWFVGLGAVGAVALPVSGFHLLIAQGAALLLTE